MKENTTEHHLKELDDDKMIVCHCHMTLEQYAAAADSIRIVKKGSQQVVVSKIVAAPSKPFGAIR